MRVKLRYCNISLVFDPADSFQFIQSQYAFPLVYNSSLLPQAIRLLIFKKSSSSNQRTPKIQDHYRRNGVHRICMCHVRPKKLGDVQRIRLYYLLEGNDPQVEPIRQCFGEKLCEEYLRQSAADRIHRIEQYREDDLERLARKARVRAIARPLVRAEAMVERKISKAISKVTSKISRRKLSL